MTVHTRIDQAFVVRREDAIRGSEALRDAILQMHGHEIPKRRTRIRRRKMQTRPRKPTAQTPVPARHPPDCCDKCGAPLKPNRMLVSHIQAEVAAYYGLHPSTMTSQRRSKDISHPRQLAMYLAAELTPKSLPEIGRRFGGRDHTTVIHAIKAVKARMQSDPEIAADAMVLRERLG